MSFQIFGIDTADMVANCVMCKFEGTFEEGQAHESDSHPVVYNPKDYSDTDFGCGCA